MTEARYRIRRKDSDEYVLEPGPNAKPLHVIKIHATLYSEVEAVAYCRRHGLTSDSHTITPR